MPLKVRLYVLSCAFASLVLAVGLGLRANLIAWTAVVGFGLLAFLAEQFPIEMPTGTYSVGFVLTIAAVLTAGPFEAMAAAVLGAICIRTWRSRAGIRHVFNAAQLSLTAGLAGVTYQLAGGRKLLAGVPLRDVVLPLLAATAVDFLSNTLMVAFAVALSEGRRPLTVWRAQYASLGGTYVAFAALGLLLGTLYVQMGWASVLFLLMPLLVARHAFQAAITMHGAYDATVQGLMRAIETKDPYTRGHAQRVSRLSEMTARAYGLSPERCRAIRYAALLHDVGKLTVLSGVLQKPGRLTESEYEHMKSHPERGAEIVGEIDVLKEALDGVRHHHERMDGSGYPAGLTGEQIPLFARLITVADAFDSITSTRVYRQSKSNDAALAELHKYEGIMFDTKALHALERAIEREGWTPAPERTVVLEDVADVDVASIH